MATRPELAVSAVWVAAAALIGAVVGDSIGFAIGRRYGIDLLHAAGRRFPKHFGPAHVGLAERAFERWGVVTVIVGRFIAILRILAGPLAGALKMPYRRFMPANVVGGVLWTVGTTAAVYGLGVAAEVWLRRFSWGGLAVAVVVGLVVGILLKKRLVAMFAAAARADTQPGEGAPAS